MANKLIHSRPQLSDRFLIQEGLWDLDDSYDYDDYNDYYEYEHYDLDFVILPNELERYKFMIPATLYNIQKTLLNEGCHFSPVSIEFGYEIQGSASWRLWSHPDDHGVTMNIYYDKEDGVWRILYEFNRTMKTNLYVGLDNHRFYKSVWNNDNLHYEEIIVNDMTSEKLNKYIKMFYDKQNLHKKMMLKNKIKNIGRMK